MNANVSTYAIDGLSDGVLSRARLFKYKPIKFSANFGSLGFNTNILYNRLQPYGGGAGPIMLTSNTPLNGLITMGASDLMEDHRINGGFKIGTNFKDNEWFVNYQNLKRKIDWGITYYRNVIGTDVNLIFSPSYREITPGKLFTNLYQANVSYPFDESKSIRLWGTGVGNEVGKLIGHSARVTDFDFGIVDGTAVILTGSDDGCSLLLCLLMCVLLHCWACQK